MEFVLDNNDLENWMLVIGLVARLGIGGIAVAMATQNILGDLFASLFIMLDKPFEVGDFIIKRRTGPTVPDRTVLYRGRGRRPMMNSSLPEDAAQDARRRRKGPGQHCHR